MSTVAVARVARNVVELVTSATIRTPKYAAKEATKCGPVQRELHAAGLAVATMKRQKSAAPTPARAP